MENAIGNISTEMVEAGSVLLQRQLDQNPAAVYLATLRPAGRRGMLRALNLIAEIASAGCHDAFSLPWHMLRYQHTAAISSILVERGYKPNTINQALAGMRNVLYHAWRLELIEGEDYRRARDVKNVKVATLPRGRALASSEVAELLKECQLDSSAAGIRDAALITLLYGTGLRRSELVGLRIEDYDTTEDILIIRQAKGGKDREVYLAAGVKAALSDWLELRGWQPGPIFYPVNKGGRVVQSSMSDQAVLNILKKRASAAGVKNFSPHDLRRTFISDLLDAGADIATVQKLAGHSTVTTTARYDRRGNEVRRKAVDLLNIPYYSQSS